MSGDVLPGGEHIAWLGDMGKIVLGAAIGFSTTWWFARRAEKAKNRGLGYALVFRVADATQFILQMQRMLTRQLSQVGQPGVPHKFLVVQVPLAFTWRTPVVFPPEELAILAAALEVDAVTRLGELGRLHNIIHAAAAEYAKRRELLTDKMRALTQTTVVAGTQMNAPLTPAMQIQIAPDIAVVEDLLGQLLVRLEEGKIFAGELASDIGPIVQKALRDKKFRMGVGMVASGQNGKN